MGLDVLPDGDRQEADGQEHVVLVLLLQLLVEVLHGSLEVLLDEALPLEGRQSGQQDKERVPHAVKRWSERLVIGSVIPGSGFIIASSRNLVQSILTKPVVPDRRGRGQPDDGGADEVVVVEEDVAAERALHHGLLARHDGAEPAEWRGI